MWEECRKSVGRVYEKFGKSVGRVLGKSVVRVLGGGRESVGRV